MLHCGQLSCWVASPYARLCVQLRSRTPNGRKSITGKNNHLLLVVGVPRLVWGVSPLLLGTTGASAACCCRMWKMAVLEGR